MSFERQCWPCRSQDKSMCLPAKGFCVWPHEHMVCCHTANTSLLAHRFTLMAILLTAFWLHLPCADDQNGMAMYSAWCPTAPKSACLGAKHSIPHFAHLSHTLALPTRSPWYLLCAHSGHKRVPCTLLAVRLLIDAPDVPWSCAKCAHACGPSCPCAAEPGRMPTWPSPCTAPKALWGPRASRTRATTLSGAARCGHCGRSADLDPNSPLVHASHRAFCKCSLTGLWLAACTVYVFHHVAELCVSVPALPSFPCMSCGKLFPALSCRAR